MQHHMWNHFAKFRIVCSEARTVTPFETCRHCLLIFVVKRNLVLTTLPTRKVQQLNFIFECQETADPICASCHLFNLYIVILEGHLYKVSYVHSVTFLWFFFFVLVTSKVDRLALVDASTENLDFHGEALCSISDVALLEIVTKARGKPDGYRKILKVQGSSSCLRYT